MKKIIVPVDFSEHSVYAMEAAAILAKRNNAQILALHMLELSESSFSEQATNQPLNSIFFYKRAEQEFETFLKQDFLKDIKVIPAIKKYKVFKEVNDVAKHENADLIIMGSHGASGLNEIFVGSNTERVVRHSETPVLVVKSKPENMKFDHVVYGCDFTDESISSYIKVTKFFAKMDSQVHLLYVNLPDFAFKSTNEMEARVAEFLKKTEGNLKKMKDVVFYSDYSIEKGVLNYSAKIGADLIAVSTHGRKGIAHFFEGSISEDIANHSVLPVMTFRI
ncbi:universal stress protein [Paucihalobacter ruber]|uniref:Universal stress protein n=1 Tax=Paucihalobacter ruber TaxID=2567861 RepID=A0A506PGE7_9FLAO|nr:universal stress protein [Paucihalobacter ruber]TPV32931.1 universal stress protein [Paucihalobacter ruber]